eukprot:5556966-Pleurochrysis_carterae.AAC.1
MSRRNVVTAGLRGSIVVLRVAVYERSPGMLQPSASERSRAHTRKKKRSICNLRDACAANQGDSVLFLANVKHFGAINGGEYAAFSRLFCQAFADFSCQTAGILLSVAIKT